MGAAGDTIKEVQQSSYFDLSLRFFEHKSITRLAAVLTWLTSKRWWHS